MNGESDAEMQSTAGMIFGVAELVAYISNGSITLEPGDVIATGTPPGVAFGRPDGRYLQDGDTVEVEIERIGVLGQPRGRVMSRREARAALRASKRISSNVTSQPAPVGDCASKPIAGSTASPSVKCRTRLHARPSVEAWNANAGPIQAMRSRASSPPTPKPFASSEASRVTTETTIGSASGENSKQSFAQVRSSAWSIRTPASNVASKPTRTRALKR